MTRNQASEQLLLDWAFGWLTLKLNAHHLHCPDGSAQKSLIEYFKTELPQMRKELCWISSYHEFEIKISHFRNTIGAVESVLSQSKEIIIAHRSSQEAQPFWPNDLEWA